MLNYDPDGVPQVDTEMIAKADALGLRLIHIICDEPGAKVGDHNAVSFFAAISFLPRIGERIRLEDGKVCQVRQVYHSVSFIGDRELFILSPNVVAVRVSPPDKEDDSGD